MKTNAGLREMLDGLGCGAPIRFSRIRFPYRAEGLCIPVLGVFIDEKYRAVPDPWLRAVVCHEVGHWRDPLVWVGAGAILAGVINVFLWLCAPMAWPVAPLWSGVLIITALVIAPWKERRADAAARRLMPDYDEFDKPYPGEG